MSLSRSLILSLILIALTGGACTPVTTGTSPNFDTAVSTPPPAVPADPYVLQPGDVLEVKSLSYPEINDKLSIRPDGMIGLQGIPEVKAAGLAPAALETLINQKYAKLFRKPDISLLVKEFSAQKVFVGGEVKNPGLYNISGNLTALQAIFQAGGFADTATLTTVVILRNQGTGQPAFKTIDLKQDLYIRESINDIPLKPYDVVFVPKSQIAQLNQLVNQYFEKLFPITKSAGFSYVFGPTFNPW